jgi:hypothetical protein
MIVRVLALLVISLGIIGALILLFFPKQSAQLEVVNQSQEEMHHVTVLVAGNSHSLGTLSSGEAQKVMIHDYSDDSWVIEGRWPDGDSFRHQCGYITHGMSFDHIALFTQNRELTFKSRH